MGDYFIEDRQANYLVYMQNIASVKEADNDNFKKMKLLNFNNLQ